MSEVGNDWDGFWSATFNSDNEGTAVIPLVPYGNIEIYGSCDGYLDHYSSISFPSQDDIQITLYPIEQTTNATISGTVTTPDGSQNFFPPIVFAVNTDSTQTTFQNFVDQNGDYTLPVLSGDYQIPLPLIIRLLHRSDSRLIIQAEYSHRFGQQNSEMLSGLSLCLQRKQLEEKSFVNRLGLLRFLRLLHS
jgi:hypothetical protein